MRVRIVMVGLLALGVTAGADAATIYRWVDANGVTHYSDFPPRGVNAVPMALDGGSARRPAAANETAPPAPETGPTTPAGVAQSRAEACETARGNLATLQGNPRVYAIVDGERRLLTGAEREARIAEEQQIVNDFCEASAPR